MERGCENARLNGEPMSIADYIDAAGGCLAMAERHGIPPRTVYDWRAGKRTPPPWLLTNLWLASVAMEAASLQVLNGGQPYQ